MVCKRHVSPECIFVRRNELAGKIETREPASYLRLRSSDHSRRSVVDALPLEGGLQQLQVMRISAGRVLETHT